MDYKELFKRAILLISSPAKAWEEIGVEEDGQKNATSFVYILIALCGLSFFIGSLLGNEVNNLAFQKALTVCCSTIVSLFGGYFLAAYAINHIGVKMYRMADDYPLAQQFTGYAMVVTFLLSMLTGLLPGFLILRWIFQFYIVYVVWEGARVLLKLDEQRIMSYTIIASLVLILSPTILEYLFNKLIFILN